MADCPERRTKSHGCPLGRHLYHLKFSIHIYIVASCSPVKIQTPWRKGFKSCKLSTWYLLGQVFAAPWSIKMPASVVPGESRHPCSGNLSSEPKVLTIHRSFHLSPHWRLHHFTDSVKNTKKQTRWVTCSWLLPSLLGPLSLLPA